jgi:hypothetical protein
MKKGGDWKFLVGGGRWDGEKGDNGNGKRTNKKVDGQRKWEQENKHKGEHKEKIRRRG